MKRIYSGLLLSALFISMNTGITLAENKPVEPKTLDKNQEMAKEASTFALKSAIKKASNKPAYHPSSPVNYMGKPAAFFNFNENYHILYESQPYSLNGGYYYLGHLKSKDLVHWETEPIALAPSNDYDNKGVFSGSAINKDNQIILFYTGRTTKDNIRKETQNIATSNDGTNFEKLQNNPIINTPPSIEHFKISQADFKNPYIWKHENYFYTLIGTRKAESKDGLAVLYKSQDLKNWSFAGLTAVGHNSGMGSLWEDPALINISGQDLLVLSLQGVNSPSKRYQNKILSGAMTGSLDYNTGKFTQKGAFILFDNGFDFVSPKFLTLKDGRIVLVGRLGMDNATQPEKSEKWAGMLSIPRELKIKDNKILTTPLKELQALRQKTYIVENQIIKTEKSYSSINGDVYEMELEAYLTKADSFTIKLRTSQDNSEETVLTYKKDKELLILNRDKSGEELKGERESEVSLKNGILKLHIFSDKSSLEIFANDGESTMSTRIFPNEKSTNIKFSAQGEAKIKTLKFYKLKQKVLF